MNFGRTIKNFKDHVLMTAFIEFHVQDWGKWSALKLNSFVS